jgi:hypothetical protein
VGSQLVATLELGSGASVLQAKDLPGSPRLFCGFCRDADNTNGFELPERPCTSHDDCAQPFESCAQRSAGAFRIPSATVVAMSGATDGMSLADGQSHDTDLVSLFCVPPTGGGGDALADFPGPIGGSLRGAWRLSVGVP